jgi:hypothetical protein
MVNKSPILKLLLSNGGKLEFGADWSGFASAYYGSASGWSVPQA